MPTGNFLDIIILFGSVQGFITAFILFSQKKNIRHKLLSIILFIISLACLNIYLFQVLPEEVPFIILLIERLVPLIIIMPLGPLVYFYVKTTLHSSFSWKEVRIHFAPTLLEFIPSIQFIILVILYLVGVLPEVETESTILFTDLFQKYMDVPRWLSTTIYLFFSIKLLRANQVVNKKKTWLNQFLIGFTIFQVVWLFHLIPYLIPSASPWLLQNLGWYPIYVPLTILVYWLGINGMIQSRTGQTPSVDQNESDEIIQKLNKLMESEKLYLDPNLTQSIILDKTGFTQKSISSALNQYHGKSFNEYVNGFRVEEVKRKLSDRSFDHLSITGIALESGFNSQATFQRAFKTATQLTPKGYRASLGQKQ